MAEENVWNGPDFSQIETAATTIISNSQSVNTGNQAAITNVIQDVGVFKADFNDHINELKSLAARDIFPPTFDSSRIDQLGIFQRTIYGDNQESVLAVNAARYDQISENLTEDQLRERVLSVMQDAYARAGVEFKPNEFDWSEIAPHEYVQAPTTGELHALAPADFETTNGKPIWDWNDMSFIKMTSSRSGFLGGGRDASARRESMLAAIFKHIGITSYNIRDFGLIAHRTLPSRLSKNPKQIQRTYIPNTPTFKTAVTIGNNFVCSICHRTLINWYVSYTALEHRITYDFLRANNLTGGNTYDNMFPTHAACNGKRSNHTFFTWTKNATITDFLNNSEELQLISGIEDEDLAEYVYYTRFKTMNEAEAVARAVPYIERNVEEHNFINKGMGHWTPLQSDEQFQFEGTDLEKLVDEAFITKRISVLQKTNASSDIGQQVAALEIKVFEEGLRESKSKIEEILKGIHNVGITYEEVHSGKIRKAKIGLRIET